MHPSSIELNNICGNARQFSYLSKVLHQETDRPHAILLAGPEHTGKYFGLAHLLQEESETAALDSLDIKPLEDKVAISVDQIRELQARISRRPLSGKYWIRIDDAATLTEESANALLKILEEPRTNCTFFLLTSSIHRVPKTIISRCLVINFLSVSSDEIYQWLHASGLSAPASRMIAAASNGCPGIALTYTQQPDALAEWQDRGRLICSVMIEPIHERLQTLQTLLPLKSTTGMANSIIRQWLGISRDILLIQHARRAQIHTYIEPTLRTLSQHIPRSRMLRLMRTLIEALGVSQMPVQSKTLLENCALSI